MVFAVIVVGFKLELLIIEGTVNAETCRRNIEILEFMDDLDQLYGPLQWIFQQDGAPAHTARSTVAWLGHGCTMLAGWPANSPDLSPIELCWAIVKNTVPLLMPTTIDQLKKIVAHAWKKIPQRSFDRLCMSFPARLLLCRNEAVSVFQTSSGIGESQALWDTWSNNRQLVHLWTPAEDQLLIDVNLRYGNCWKKSATLLEDPTSIQVKTDCIQP
jgi:hypothetical protein